MSEIIAQHMPPTGALWALDSRGTQLEYVGDRNGMPVYELTLRGFRCMDFIVDAQDPKLPVYIAKPGDTSMLPTKYVASARVEFAETPDGDPIGMVNRVSMSSVLKGAVARCPFLLAQLYGTPVVSE